VLAQIKTSNLMPEFSQYRLCDKSAGKKLISQSHP